MGKDQPSNFKQEANPYYSLNLVSHAAVFINKNHLTSAITIQ